MFGIAHRGLKWNQGKLGVGNVLVLLNLNGYDRQEATNQWKTKALVNKPKQELQRD